MVLQALLNFLFRKAARPKRQSVQIARSTQALPLTKSFSSSTSSSNSLDNGTWHTKTKQEHEVSSEIYVEEDEEDEAAVTWAPIRAIADEMFIQLIHRVTNADLAHDSKIFKVEKRLEGAFNHAVILSNGITKWVIKVPSIGTEERWCPEHAEVMRSEVHTMNLIKHRLPQFPIPTVLHYDFGFNNEIGAPYTVQSFVQGTPAIELWFGIDENGDPDATSADCPSDELEQKRTTFLKSLAKAMAELRHLEFDGVGMVFLEDGNLNKPFVGPYHGYDSRSLDDIKRLYWRRPVFNTASDLYAQTLDSKFGTESNSHITGMHMILEIMFQSEVFASSKKQDDDEQETFVLQHHDLNWQNILVSESGEVVGILDWDGAGTVPRCVGYASLPMWLRSDWEMDYIVPETSMHMLWTLEKYRKIYSTAMIEACGGLDTDAKYTLKSCMYEPLHWILFGTQSSIYRRAEDFIKKIFLEIPPLRRVENIEPFAESIGEGWDDGEELLQEWLPKILALN